MSYFAKSLKLLRQESDLSMQALADKACVSKSMISKIERDEVQPTLDVAARLAKALGKTLSEMLHAPQQNQVIYLSKNEQAVWEDVQQIKRRNISPVFEGLKIEWLQVELPAGASIQKCIAVNTEGAEKYILVTKGVLEVRVSHQVFHMKKGDSLYFNAACPHDFINSSNNPAEYYVVVKHA